MKSFVVVSALAAVASASMQVHVFSDNACKVEIPLERNALQVSRSGQKSRALGL